MILIEVVVVVGVCFVISVSSPTHGCFLFRVMFAFPRLICVTMEGSWVFLMKTLASDARETKSKWAVQTRQKRKKALIYFFFRGLHFELRGRYRQLVFWESFSRTS